MPCINVQYVKSPCEIKTLTNDLLTTAVVKSVQDDYIELVNPNDKLPMIHCDTQLKINIFNNTLGFKFLVGKVFLSTPDFMKIIEVQTLSDFERRNFFRIKVNLGAKAYLIEEDIPSDGAMNLFPVHITDLSLSGCFLTTQKKLDINQRMVINFNLNSYKNVALCAKVQRKKTVSVNINGYGCSFLDISPRQSDILCTYIFEKQRQQIKSLKESQSGYNQ